MRVSQFLPRLAETDGQYFPVQLFVGTVGWVVSGLTRPTAAGRMSPELFGSWQRFPYMTKVGFAMILLTLRRRMSCAR